MLRAADSPVPAWLAFALLAAQMLLPWTVPRLITQDGPSHLYTAVVAWDLVFHPASIYSAVYQLQPLSNPNWATTAVLGILSALAGVESAEKLLMSLGLLGGFLAFNYAVRSLYPGARWTPIANFLVQTWFLWIGYYNFYLGMVLCLFMTGYYLRHARTLTGPKALLIGLGGVGLGLTHPVPAGLLLMALITLASWAWLWDRRPSPWLWLAISPAAAMLLLFARSTAAPARYFPDIQRAWATFPMQVFATAGGAWGAQRYCWPLVLLLIVVGIALMRRDEWRGPRGALVLVTALCLVFYSVLPDHGFGGGEAKIRFAWATFLFGALAVSTVSRLRRWQLPIAVVLGAMLAVNLMVTRQTARGLSDVAGDYLAATAVIPPHARFVRLRYHTPTIPWRYGFSGNWSDPLLHLDAYVAAERQSVDLADWQQANPVFSVSLRPAFTSAQRKALWSLEAPFPDGAATLRQLLRTLPVPIDYVVVVGENTPEAARGTDYAQLTTELSRTMQPMATSRNGFVRVYQARGGLH